MDDLQPHGASRPDGVSQAEARHAVARQRSISTMINAALLAVLGTLIFAWALRAPEYPWLFAIGLVPWGVGLVIFVGSLWSYSKG